MMIKKLANPYSIAFFLPWMIIFILTLIVLMVPGVDLNVLRKTIYFSPGESIRNYVSELLYDGLGVISITAQSNWISWVVKCNQASATMFNAIIAMNIAMIVAIPMVIIRWFSLYFKAQAEVQALKNDRKFIKR